MMIGPQFTIPITIIERVCRHGWLCQLREFIQLLYSESDDFLQLDFDTDIPKVRDGSAAACQGCVLLLDAIDTYSDGHLSEDCIEKVSVCYYERSNPHCWRCWIILYCVPDTAVLPLSSPLREEDVHCMPRAASLKVEAPSSVPEIELELFLL
jgi:hypothetical protein